MKVFTNGVFDILHVGHVRYLQASKDLFPGAKLIVGINSDASVRRLKGDKRPINPQDIRREMLLSLRCVDEVIVFDEDTPYNLIKQISPDVITKGGDYQACNVVGHDLAPIRIIPYHQGYSTTRYEAIINR